MTLPRLLLLPIIACGLAACSTVPGQETFRPRYYCVQVTDYRGHLVAKWVAHGYVHRTEAGYAFQAVERVSGPPFVQRIRYPEGHKVEVTGPNIIVTRCGEPLWHYEMRAGGGVKE